MTFSYYDGDLCMFYHSSDHSWCIRQWNMFSDYRLNKRLMDNSSNRLKLRLILLKLGVV